MFGYINSYRQFSKILMVVINILMVVINILMLWLQNRFHKHMLSNIIVTYSFDSGFL
jgi:hypothetical protein